MSPMWTFPVSYARRTDGFEAMLHAACNAHPTPIHSNYHVRGAALTSRGTIVQAGNHEYGIVRAIHAEEALVARASEAAPGEPIVAIGFVKDGFDPTKAVSPCGNCRDVLAQYASPDAVIIGAGTSGGTATVKPLRDYFFDAFAPMNTDLSDRVVDAAHRAVFAKRVAFQRFVPQNIPTYGASLVCSKGYVASASIDSDVAYHPSLPIRNAITVMRFSGERVMPQMLVVANEWEPPRVPYLERQHLLGFTRHIAGLKDLPVILVQMENNQITHAWKTTASQWLPFPFMPDL